MMTLVGQSRAVAESGRNMTPHAQLFFCEDRLTFKQEDILEELCIVQSLCSAARVCEVHHEQGRQVKG